MPYIGNPIYQSAFVTDQFSGNGSTTAFTMSVAPAGVSNVLVAVSGVLQDPSTYGVSGNTLTFSAAPPSGTGNISCRYLGIPVTGVVTTAYRTVTEFTATASQTTFTPPSYTVGYINVYRNGVLLGSADYTASNGTTVVLATGATAGDLVTVESFRVESVLNAIPNAAGAVTSNNIQTSVAVTTPTMTSPTISSGPLTIGTTAIGAGNSAMMKNRIINGNMVIDQRNSGASVTNTASTTLYSLDRWNVIGSQASKYTVQQNAGSVTPPAGFTNYLGVTSSSAYTVGATDYFSIRQFIEGYNIADMNQGSANAKTFTLSFWVRSSLTGTFGGSIANSSYNRCYPYTYTISAANTWEQKSITVTGCPNGTWNTTNGQGLIIEFGLGVGTTYSGTAGAWTSTPYDSATGATSVVGTSGATWYVTGVQLEVGSSATAYDYRPYTTELSLCQRYLPAWVANLAVQFQGQASSGTNAYIPIQHPVQTRVAPTGISTSSMVAIVSSSSGSGLVVTGLSFTQASNMTTFVSATVASGLTAGNASFLIFNGGSLFFTGCEL